MGDLNGKSFSNEWEQKGQEEDGDMLYSYPLGGKSACSLGR